HAERWWRGPCQARLIGVTTPQRLSLDQLPNCLTGAAAVGSWSSVSRWQLGVAVVLFSFPPAEDVAGNGPPWEGFVESARSADPVIQLLLEQSVRAAHVGDGIRQIQKSLLTAGHDEGHRNRTGIRCRNDRPVFRRHQARGGGPVEAGEHR